MNATWTDTLVFPWQRRSIVSGPAASSRKDIHFAHLRSTSIRYRVAGAGAKTIVLATDPPVTLEQYDDLIGYLSREFRVVVFENPAFGFSLPRLGMGFAFESACAIALEFLTHLNQPPYVPAFPCASAYVAIRLAGMHPELVSDLVVIQAPDWHEELKWKRRCDPKNILGLPYLGQIFFRLTKRRNAGIWYRWAVGNKGLLDQFLQPTLHAFAHGARFSLASSFQQYLIPPEPNFPKVRQPTLIIWGLVDRTHRGTDMASTLRYAPHAQVVHLETAGHFPELEQPARFAQELDQFLSHSGHSQPRQLP